MKFYSEFLKFDIRIKVVRKNIWIAFIAIIFTNCISTKKMARKGPKVSSVNVTLPAYYSNFKPGDPEQSTSLWNKLHISHHYISTKYSEDAIVELNRMDNQSITFYLTENDTRIDSLTLNGKIKKNYFSAKRIFSATGIPLIKYYYLESKILIGFLADKSLVIKWSNYRYGNIFLFSGGNSEIFWLKYKPK